VPAAPEVVAAGVVAPLAPLAPFEQDTEPDLAVLADRADTVAPAVDSSGGLPDNLDSPADSRNRVVDNRSPGADSWADKHSPEAALVVEAVVVVALAAAVVVPGLVPVAVVAQAVQPVWRSGRLEASISLE